MIPLGVVNSGRESHGFQFSYTYIYNVSPQGIFYFFPEAFFLCFLDDHDEQKDSNCNVRGKMKIELLKIRKGLQGWC